MGPPIFLQALSEGNSITLPGSFVVPSAFSSFPVSLHVNVLVDSGSTVTAFLDRHLAQSYGLQTSLLPAPRPLFLADGRQADLVTHQATGTLHLGSRHIEVVDALLTDLGKGADLILGFPWLQTHNPVINWRTGSLQFRKNAESARRAQYPPSPTVEVVPDEGEPGSKHDEVSPLLSVDADLFLASEEPRAQAMNITPVTEASVTTARKPRYAPYPEECEPMNELDIRLLKAPNFMLVARQPGVRVACLSWGELEDLCKPHVQLPDMPEEDWRSLLRGQGNLQNWKERFADKRTHDFLNHLFDPASQGEYLRRITEEDAAKFLQKPIEAQ